MTVRRPVRSTLRPYRDRPPTPPSRSIPPRSRTRPMARPRRCRGCSKGRSGGAASVRSRILKRPVVAMATAGHRAARRDLPRQWHRAVGGQCGPGHQRIDAQARAHPDGAGTVPLVEADTKAVPETERAAASPGAPDSDHQASCKADSHPDTGTDLRARHATEADADSDAKTLARAVAKPDRTTQIQAVPFA